VLTRDDAHVVGRLVRLAAPVALGRVGIVTMGVVDTVVVGRLAPHELAHQAIGWAMPGPALLGGIGLLTGVTVLAARALGEGRPGTAVQVWRSGLVLAVVTGLLACVPVWLVGERVLLGFGIAADLARPAAAVARVLVLSIPFHLVFVASTYFLEALQRPAPGAVAMWIANGLNLLLNLLLVPSWGAIGSAWATVLSRLFLAAAMVAYVGGSRRLVVHHDGAGAIGLGALLAIGGAAAVAHGVEAGAFSAASMIAGRLGTTAAATLQMSMSLLTLVFMMALGLSTAGAVLVSDAVGRGAARDATRAGWWAIGLAALAAAACSGPGSRGPTRPTRR